MRLAIRRAEADETDLVRELFREYQAAAAAPVCFTTFEQELASLPHGYAGILLAWLDGVPAGCVAWRELAGDVVEMKRLYVRASARGAGVGQKLVDRLLVEIRGYRLIRLDTLPHMSAAIRLYRRLGFLEIPRYNDNPEPGALFFERPLD